MVIQIYGTPNDNQAIRDVKKGDINDALSFEYEPFFCGVGTFTLELPLTTPFATELVENNLLYIKEDDTGLIIKNVKRNNDKITVVGYDLNGMLLDRITMERDTGVEGAEGKDCFSGSTETCVKHFVEYNMISSPDIFRNYPRLAVAEDLERGIANDSDLVGKECLEDVVRTLCEGAGLGYRIKLVMSESQTEPLLIFDVYEREDHTADQSECNRVIFSEGMGNLTQIERETGITAEKNAVWCDTGGENMFVYKTDEDGEPFNPVSWNRREEYISLSVTDSYDTEEIELTARKQMADKYAQTNSLTVEAGNPLDYGTVYKLGDIVTVYDKKRSLQLNSVISSVLIKRSGEEHSVQITLGERKPKLLDKYVKQNQLQRKAQTDFPPTAGNSTSGAGLLASYEYVSDNSIKYNGMTYTVSKDGTGLITKISDSEGAEFSPTVSGTITDVAFHNAVLTAVAMLCGLPSEEEKFITANMWALYDINSLDFDNATWNNYLSEGYDIALTGGSLVNGYWHVQGSDYGVVTIPEPDTIYLVYQHDNLWASSVYHSLISKNMADTTQYYAFDITLSPSYTVVLSCRGAVVDSGIKRTDENVVVCIARHNDTAKLYVNGILYGDAPSYKGHYNGEYCLNRSLRGGQIWDSPTSGIYRFVGFGGEQSEAVIIANSKYLMKQYGVVE